MAWGKCIGMSGRIKATLNLRACPSLSLLGHEMITPEGKQWPLRGSSESRCRMWAELSPAKEGVLFAAFHVLVSLPQVRAGL